MDINEVIGIRLGQIVGEGAGAKFCKEMSKDVGEEWTKQTYYDALHGRRIFRVSELVALARAANVQASQLLDAKEAGVSTVTISRRHAPIAVSISASDLLDLFKVPGKAIGGLKLALANIENVLDNLIGSEATPPPGGLAHKLVISARLIRHVVKEVAK